jgi:hypothetical protein
MSQHVSAEELDEQIERMFRAALSRWVASRRTCSQLRVSCSCFLILISGTASWTT